MAFPGPLLLLLLLMASSMQLIASAFKLPEANSIQSDHVNWQDSILKLC
jgi:hypothetical protein